MAYNVMRDSKCKVGIWCSCSEFLPQISSHTQLKGSIRTYWEDVKSTVIWEPQTLYIMYWDMRRILRKFEIQPAQRTKVCEIGQTKQHKKRIN